MIKILVIHFVLFCYFNKFFEKNVFVFILNLKFFQIMSVDRYIAVCLPFSKNFQNLRSRSRGFGITLAAWFFSIIMCLPVILAVIRSGVLPDCTCE